MPMSFTPVIRTSKSIPRSLLEFSRDRGVDVKLLDFELLSDETLIKRADEQEYLLVEDLKDITEDDLKNPETIIIQEYQIQIIPLRASKSTLKLSLLADKFKTKASLTINKGSVFNKKSHTVKSLEKKIHKRKLRAGLFIKIFEDNLDKKLQKLLQSIPYDKPLSKDISFTVAQAKTPLRPIDAKLKKIFEQKEQEADNAFAGIKSGELIAEYTFEKKGSWGRGANGKFISPREPRLIHPKPDIDETVSAKVSDEHIEYFTNINGYVIYKNNLLTVSKNLKLQGASFKKTANINAQDADNDISVHIAHNKSHAEDAIGSGVNIDVKELNVDGSIASNVKISTDNLQIDAQTHKNSKMQVKDTAKIKLHRGDLSTKEAEIAILESGKITASKSAYIGQTLGGVIIAPVVRIDEMMSNTTVIASELIEIKSITGENNKLIINPDAIESYHKELVALKENIEMHQKDLQEQKNILAQNIKKHASGIERIKVFQKRIIKATKEGKAPMKQDVLRVKQFKKDSEKYQIQKEDLEHNAALTALQTQLNKMCSMDLHAKIKSKTLYNGHTRVTFIDPNTKEEITFMPEGRTAIISLKLDSDNKRVILTEDES